MILDSVIGVKYSVCKTILLLPWTEKYRPKVRSDLMGNETAINGLYLFLKNWKRGKSNSAILLLGPPGCGKTTSAYVIANELNYLVTEVNASDTRSKKTLQNSLRFTTQFQRLDTNDQKQMILMDEVDGISGQNDRGGLTEFVKLLKTSRIPVVCTANDPDSDKIIDLVKKTKIRTLTFERTDEFEIIEILSKIVKAEGLEYNETNIQVIAESASGDVRAAINELQSFYFGNDVFNLEKRDKQVILLDLFTKLFKSKSIAEARKVWSNAPSDYSFLLLQIFDLAYKQCKTPHDLSQTYEQIALADLTLSRIMRTQDYSLLRHFFNFIGPGIYLARQDQIYSKITKIDPYPSGWKLRGIAKAKNNKASMIVQNVTPKIHISKSRFLNDEFNYVSKILLGEKGSEVAAWFDLDDDQVDVIQKLNPKSKLTENMESARKLVGEKRMKDGETHSSGQFLLDEIFTSYPYKKQEEDSDDEVDEEEIIEAEHDTKGQSSLDEFF